MSLKHGADCDKLKYVVRRTWLSKGLFIEFECISMKVYEMYGLIIEYEICGHDMIMSKLL